MEWSHPARIMLGMPQSKLPLTGSPDALTQHNGQGLDHSIVSCASNVSNRQVGSPWKKCSSWARTWHIVPHKFPIPCKGCTSPTYFKPNSFVCSIYYYWVYAWCVLIYFLKKIYKYALIYFYLVKTKMLVPYIVRR
jgi:hypothetical protein